MVRRFAVTIACSGLITIAAACSKSSPVAPDIPGSGIASADAFPSGVTLKVTTPEPQWPIGGVRLDSLRPTMNVTEAAGLYVAIPGLLYRYEIVAPNGQVAYSALVNEIQHTMPGDLLLDTRYTWRARAETEGRVGPWSQFAEFLTIDYRGIVPRPPGGVWPSTGEGVIAWIIESFPERLDPTPTDDERHHDMLFLRDRIIETGICGGMDLGWNLKRGGPQISVDAITWNSPEGLKIFDLAQGFDDKHSFLRLWWVETFGAFYKAYENHPGC